jgi:signal transduction histidine kinase
VGDPLPPVAAGAIVLFGVVVALTAGPGRLPPAAWALGAAAAALPFWWSSRRAPPPAWALGAFLAAGTGFLFLRQEVTGGVILLLVGTGLGVHRLPDREALLFGCASLALALLGALWQRLLLGSLAGFATVVPSYAVAAGFILAGRFRRRHLRETERLLADLEAEHRRLEEAHAALAEHARRVADLSAAEERNRIAAEIHDVLAHALTAIIVQAEAASVCLLTRGRAGSTPCGGSAPR